MLKAVKESFKNWLVTHERLYWYIVVGLAVLGFGIVTSMGMAKLESANAAVDVTAKIGGTTTTKKVYDLWEMDWSYWLTTGDADGGCNAYDNPEELYKKIVKECNYMYVTCPSSSAVYIEYYYSTVPFEKNAITGTHYSVNTPYATCYYIYVYYGSSGPVVQKVHGRYDNKENTSVPTDNIYNNKNFCLGSSYDILGDYASDSTYATLAKEIPMGNLTYPILPLENVYSAEAPYVKFDSLSVKNDLGYNDGYLYVDLTLYEDFTEASYWKYNGILKDMDASADLKYTAQVDFVVELPTDAYIAELFNSAGVNISKESNIAKYASTAVSKWNNDVAAAKRTIKFMYIFDIVPDDNGCFSYTLTFEEILALMKYFNNDLITVFNGYEKDYLALLLSFLHIDRVDCVVHTERADSIVYGAITTNKFERGIYDAGFEVITLADKENTDASTLEQWIQWDLSIQTDEYQKYLEERLDELESQMGGMTSVDGAFADLEGSDLWTGFISLVNGLGSLGPSIRSLSALTGAVFAFLPVTITGIMSTTLFAICVIAIIKAIRG